MVTGVKNEFLAGTLAAVIAFSSVFAVTRTSAAQSNTSAALAAPASRLANAKPSLRAESVAAAKGQPALVHVLAPAAQVEAGPRAGGGAGASSALKIDAGKPTVSVNPGAQVVVRNVAPAPQAAVPLSMSKQPFPGTVFVGVKDQDDRTVAQQLQPFVVAEQLPLRWDAKAGAYVTTLIVGLDAVTEGSEPAPPLLEKVVFQISGTNVDSIEPSQVSVQTSGPGGYQRVSLATKNFASPIEISAHSDVGDEKLSGQIDPGAIIDIGASNDRIDGLGMGTTTISVIRRASNGTALPAAQPLGIELKTSAGRLSATHAEIAANASSTEVVLASSGLGDAVVGESGTQATGGTTATVHFSFPWPKLLLGLAGALAAAVLRAWSAKASRGLVFVTSVCTGVVVDILLALGAPVAPDWALQLIRGELAWLVLGFLAGFAGGSLLQKLVGGVFGIGDLKTA